MAAERNFAPLFHSIIDHEFEAVLQTWRSQGRELVARHRREFEALLDPVEAAIGRGRYAAAAAAAQVAAAYAVFWHPGAFVSHRLERALRHIGEEALLESAPGWAQRAAGRPLQILHVATQIGAIGGHARNIERWIASDTSAVHSVSMTRQTQTLPEALRAAVVASGGTTSYANAAVGGPLAWAAALQPSLAAADVVFLHVHNQDVVPFIALAGMKRRPKVVLFNHADHVFWLGADFVDAVVNTRWTGHRLCAERRDIPGERNLTMPLCLNAVTCGMNRSRAREALGLDPEDIILLTVARSVKFRPIGGLSFADALLPVLVSNRRVRLLAIGPGGVADWSAAQALAPGQIISLPETPDTKVHFEAADIYIDSFPFPSNTSLLEAGLHGLPLVSRHPFGQGCGVMSADSIGIDGCLQSPRSLDEFQSIVLRLVQHADWRRELGAATRERIEATNCGAGFRAALAELYQRVLRLPHRQVMRVEDSQPWFDDVDLYSPFVFGCPDASMQNPASDARRASAVEISLNMMQPWPRLGAWLWLARNRAFRFRSGKATLRYLIPEWLITRVRVPAGDFAK